MQIAVLGVDLGKNVCSIVGLDGTGRVILRRRMARGGVITLAKGLPVPRGDQAGTVPTIRMTDKAGVATRGGRSPTGVTTLATARS